VSVISSIGTRKEMQKMDKKKNTAEKKVWGSEEAWKVVEQSER
jgi:hypothetical protein